MSFHQPLFHHHRFRPRVWPLPNRRVRHPAERLLLRHTSASSRAQTSTHPCDSCPCTQHHQAKAASCHRSIGQRSIAPTPVPRHVNEHHRASALLRRCMIGPPTSDPTAPPCQCVVQTGQHLRCSAPGLWAPMPPPAHRRSSADPCWQGRPPHVPEQYPSVTLHLSIRRQAPRVLSFHSLKCRPHSKPYQPPTHDTPAIGHPAGPSAPRAP
jgi:hypothetical protein